MTWLVFGVSCLLALAGAVAITSGAPIIQLERGWAEVIAGSVAMSSGGVVFALGVILMRLEALRDAVTSGAPVAQAGPATETVGAALPAFVPVEPLPAAVPPEPAPPPPETVAASPADAMLPLAPTPVADEPSPPPEPAADQGLWKRIKRPVDNADALDRQGFPDRVLEETPALAVPSEPEPAATFAPTDPPPAPVLAVPAQHDPHPEPAAQDDASQLGWLERSLFKGRAAKDREATVRDLPGQDGRIEPAMGSLLREPAAEPLTALPELGSAAADTDAAPPTAPADEGPTVIGRYQAGVASYVMYSDGTIEVETEGGQSHRFGSMDELKAFIASQDDASA